MSYYLTGVRSDQGRISLLLVACTVMPMYFISRCQISQFFLCSNEVSKAEGITWLQ